MRRKSYILYTGSEYQVRDVHYGLVIERMNGEGVAFLQGECADMFREDLGEDDNALSSWVVDLHCSAYEPDCPSH